MNTGKYTCNYLHYPVDICLESYADEILLSVLYLWKYFSLKYRLLSLLRTECIWCHPFHFFGTEENKSIIKTNLFCLYTRSFHWGRYWQFYDEYLLDWWNFTWDLVISICPQRSLRQVIFYCRYLRSRSSTITTQNTFTFIICWIFARFFLQNLYMLWETD